MDLLARRDHSVQELARKLGRRFEDADQVREAIARLTEEGLQSDARYAEAYLRLRAEKGYGPLRVKQEMLQRGLSEMDVERAFRDCSVNWLDQLQWVVERKYGGQASSDYTEKSKRMRFLQYRGFTHDQIRDVLD